MNLLSPFTSTSSIAYLSMEIALEDAIPTYAGGLGILAGDTLRAAADLELPLVGVTLISRAGYFKQLIDEEGNQQEVPEYWQPEKYATRLPARVAVTIGTRDVWLQAWLYVLQGGTSFAVPVILLDTELEDNHPDDRTITHHLYGGDAAYRLKQEIVLGIGGVRMLRALGFRPYTYHMNEGHSALLALELLKQSEREPGANHIGEPRFDISAVRRQCLFTTHTPVEAGHDQFPYPLVSELMDDFIDNSTLRAYAGNERMNLTCLALNLSGYVNGVAKRHAEISTHMFPGYSVHAITNGVHPTTWTSEPIAAVFDAHIPNWRHEPELLVRADQIPDDTLWQAHLQAKTALIQTVKDVSGVTFDPQLPIIGFARRMTAYKRPDLLFVDMERLARIAAAHPFQLVIAGKAHPRDETGKQLIHALHKDIEALRGKLNIVFLPDYRMALGLKMVAGSDLWLNTPLRPLEASGTSGMKAALNAVPNLSVLDGWWIEGHIEGVTGWAIGDSEASANGNDAYALYEKLEKTILPLFNGPRDKWIYVMKNAVAKNAYYFNSLRMMRRYATEAYIR